MVAISPYASLLAAVPVADAEVEVLGSATRYWSYGPADAATIVVVVHGFRGEHHGLEPVIAQMTGIRFIAPDLPGFGASTPLTAAEHTIEGYAAWLRAFMAALGLGGAVVLGHSFGSIVVAHAVASGLETPRVILINPIAMNALHGPNALLTRLTVFYYRLASALPARAGHGLLANRAIVRFMSETMATTRDRSLRRWIHGQHRQFFSDFSDLATVVAGFDASVSADVGEVAASIAQPTLLIGSDRDPITSVAALRGLQQAMPDARLHVLGGVGHLIHYERPREAAELIVEFLGAGRLQDAMPGVRA